MARVVDYYFVPQSPWTFLGHDRFVALSRAHRFDVETKPADFGRVFATSGGLPFAQRPKQRLSYRMLELARYAKRLDVPMVLVPKHFPVDVVPASLRIVAASGAGDRDATLRFAGAVMRALWVEDRNIADAATLDELASRCGLDTTALSGAAAEPAARQRFDANTDEAIAEEVFGAPTYIPRFGPEAGHRFWGQDRLDFLEQAVAG